MTSEIHQNDVGTSFRAVIKDEDDNIINVGLATLLGIYFRKPNSDVIRQDASLVNTGTDGLIEYVTASGDLDEVGVWKLQGEVAISGGLFRSNYHTFRVYPNL